MAPAKIHELAILQEVSPKKASFCHSNQGMDQARNSSSQAMSYNLHKSGKVQEISQGVDHRNRRMLGKILNNLMSVGPYDQSVQKTGENLGCIRNAFSSSYLGA